MQKSNDKINILQLVSGLGLGGAEMIVFNLSKHLNKELFNNYVIGMSEREDLLDRFLENNIEAVSLQKTNSMKDVTQIVDYVDTFVKEHNIQIIHAHMTHSIIIASIVKLKNPSVKIVYTSHNYNIGSKARELIVYLLKAFRDTDIVLSKDILRFFHKKDYKIIPNGIEVEKYNKELPKYKKFTFINIGRLETNKNHKALIEIVKEIRDNYNYDFEVKIVGDSYLREELENLIKKFNLEDVVHLLGVRHDTNELLNKSHCFVLTSLWEGLPLVILEAGASKLPVITTPVGSIPSVITKETGYLSDLDTFKDKMVEVMENYDEAKSKGEKLFTNIQANYSIKSITQQHEKIYQDLI